MWLKNVNGKKYFADFEILKHSIHGVGRYVKDYKSGFIILNI